MRRVLLIEDDPGAVDTVSLMLRCEGFEVAAALTAREGLAIAVDMRPQVALVDLRLPDGSGLDVLRTLRGICPATVCLVITGFASCETAVEAIRLGALDYLQKPVIGDDLVDAVTRAAAIYGGPRYANSTEVRLYSLRRCAEVVTKAIDSPHDMRTLHEWGRSVGVSVGGLRNWCRTADLPARRLLLFTRVLRATIMHETHGADAQDLLDVVDRRTLTKILLQAGGTSAALPASVPEFLERQRFIANQVAINEIRIALERVLQRKYPPQSTRGARGSANGALVRA